MQAHQPGESDFQSVENSNLTAKFWEKEKLFFTDRMEHTSDDYHVLIVHYRLQTLRMMAEIFRKLGYQVATALDSAKALLYFGRKSYDLLFTDLDMPVLNGYHLARLFKNNRPGARVLAMTCRCQAELVDLMGDGIIDGWLYKPFKSKTLKEKLTDIGMRPENNSHQIKK
jgi:DNA-binding response OmpR family regulator